MVTKGTASRVTKRVSKALTADGASGGSAYVVADSDAASYITAVETADGQSLEDGVKQAIDEFVQGCKSDGIWSDMTDVVLLAGARTLDGILVPLKGTAPTNNNFVSGDYSRTGGLTGNGSTKYLATNTLDSDYPQNDYHQACWVSTLGTAGDEMSVSAANTVADSIARTTSGLFRLRSNNLSHTHSQTALAGLIGFSRSNSTAGIARMSGVSDAVTQASASPDVDIPRYVFGISSSTTIGVTGTVGNFYDGQIAFYSLGTNLSLASLDSRVGTLLTDIGLALA